MKYSMLEWYSSPIECDLTLYYNSDLNRFVTEDYEVLNDMHELLSPWQIRYAKKIGKIDGYCLLNTKDRLVIEIFFPDDYYEMLGWEVIESFYMEQVYMYKHALTKGATQ